MQTDSTEMGGLTPAQFQIKFLKAWPKKYVSSCLSESNTLKYESLGQPWKTGRGGEGESGRGEERERIPFGDRNVNK